MFFSTFWIVSIVVCFYVCYVLLQSWLVWMHQCPRMCSWRVWTTWKSFTPTFISLTTNKSWVLCGLDQNQVCIWATFYLPALTQKVKLRKM